MSHNYDRRATLAGGEKALTRFLAAAPDAGLTTQERSKARQHIYRAMDEVAAAHLIVKGDKALLALAKAAKVGIRKLNNAL